MSVKNTKAQRNLRLEDMPPAVGADLLAKSASPQHHNARWGFPFRISYPFVRERLLRFGARFGNDGFSLPQLAGESRERGLRPRLVSILSCTLGDEAAFGRTDYLASVQAIDGERRKKLYSDAMSMGLAVWKTSSSLYLFYELSDDEAAASHFRGFQGVVAEAQGLPGAERVLTTRQEPSIDLGEGRTEGLRQVNSGSAVHPEPIEGVE